MYSGTKYDVHGQGLGADVSTPGRLSQGVLPQHCHTGCERLSVWDGESSERQHTDACECASVQANNQKSWQSVLYADAFACA